jgi:uncharacterized protein
MDFEWDDKKHDATRIKRGFGFNYAMLIFASKTLDRLDDRFDYGEERIISIGRIKDDILCVVHTKRDEFCRIISARPANKKERRAWHLFE